MTRLQPATIILSLTLTLIFLASCSGVPISVAQVPTRVEVVATEMNFTPSQVTAKVGQPITIVYRNEGVVEHDWAVLDLPAYDVDVKMATAIPHPEGPHEHALDTPDVHITALPGQYGELIFTPDAPGRYTIVCTITGHKEAGMMGMLTVVE